MDNTPSTPSIKMLKLIERLISELREAEVRFCHWKSNFHLQYALGGAEDWDVLIDAQHFEKFESVLSSCGFKQATQITTISQPGVFHFYGLDPSGSIVHAHAYSRILTGDSLVKSYAIPFERMLLANIEPYLGMPIPSRAAEKIVFILRNAIKYSTLIDFLMIERNHNVISQENLWLSDANDFDCKEILEKHFPGIGLDQLTNAAEIFSSKGQLVKKIRTGYIISRHLQKYRRYSHISTTWKSTKMLVQLLTNKYFYKRKYMNPSKGGAIITFVGPQATGKSTLAALLFNWLNTEFEVDYIHIGKPPPTWLTFFPRLLLPVARTFLPSQRSTVVEKALETKKDAGPLVLNYLHIFRKLMLAYDRATALKKVFRNRCNGRIVICDRYPAENLGVVDGASFSEETILSQASPFKRALMKLETKMYDNVNSPDLVIELTVPPEVAVQRDDMRDKPGSKNPDYVRFRHSSKQPLFTRCPVEKIDTNRDIDLTLLDVKHVVWRNL
jgi:thymidylate kinase